MFYCENHANYVLYSQKHDIFSNFYKQCRGIDDFKVIGNNESLLKKLNDISIDGVTSRNLEKVKRKWFSNHPLPIFEYKEDSWDEDEDDKDEELIDNKKKLNYKFYSENGYIYEQSPLSSPLILYGGESKKFKIEYL